MQKIFISVSFVILSLVAQSASAVTWTTTTIKSIRINPINGAVNVELTDKVLHLGCVNAKWLWLAPEVSSETVPVLEGQVKGFDELFAQLMITKESGTPIEVRADGAISSCRDATYIFNPYIRFLAP